MQWTTSFILFHGDASDFRYRSLPRNVKLSQVTKLKYRLWYEHLTNRHKIMVRRGFKAHEDVTAASNNKASLQRYNGLLALIYFLKSLGYLGTNGTTMCGWLYDFQDESNRIRQSSGVLCHVDGWTVPDVSGDNSALIFTVKKSTLLGLRDA